VVSGGEKGLRARLGRMRHLLCQTGHHVDVQMDEEPGVWLRSFHLLDLEEHCEVSADGDPLTIAFAFSACFYRRNCCCINIQSWLAMSYRTEQV